MTSEASAVKCLSWNINGSFANKIPILDVVFEQNEVVCLQEHFVTSRSKSILSFNSSVSVYSVSAKQLSGKGRPTGGIATFVRSTLRSSAFEVNDNFLAIRLRAVFLLMYICLQITMMSVRSVLLLILVINSASVLTVLDP